MRTSLGTGSIQPLASGERGASACAQAPVYWDATEELYEKLPAIGLLEAGNHFAGPANTVDLSLDGIPHGVDTGFLGFNHRT